MVQRQETLDSQAIAPLNFHTAYKKEFQTHTLPRTRHIRHIRVQDDHDHNKMERMNGEIRVKEKTLRGLKKPNTPILKGYEICHNFIRDMKP